MKNLFMKNPLILSGQTNTACAEKTAESTVCTDQSYERTGPCKQPYQK